MDEDGATHLNLFETISFGLNRKGSGKTGIKTGVK